MSYEPTDVANEALDFCGCDIVLGDIEEGTREAQICLRHYRLCLQQLLRGARWNFARKQAPLTLLADGTASTPNVGTIVPYPWIYEYALPIDCMQARFVLWNATSLTPGIPPGNIQIPPTPPIGGLGQPPLTGWRMMPARFLVANDFNYPPQPGQLTWNVQGVSPAGRTVILTNVQNAVLVYTCLVLYPSLWDPLFRGAMSAYLAAEIALPIWIKKDRKFGMQIQAQQAKIAMEKISQARVSDGNEAMSSSDIPVDWLQARRTGGYGGWGDSGWGGDCGGAGVMSYGWDSVSIAGGPF